MPPNDIAGSLGPWLRRAGRLTGLAEGPELADRLAEIDRRRLDTFRLAVLGSGRGFQNLVDMLLGIPALPRTASLQGAVLVQPSADPRLEIDHPGRERLVLSLEESSWDQAAGHPAAVRVLVDSEFLRAVDGELVVLDSERGAGTDPGSDPAAGDVVVLAVTASSPLGMDERTLLERQLRDGHVQRVAVVVTGLDQIDPDERETVLRYIRNRAGKIAPGVELLTAPLDTHDGEVKELREAVLRLTDPAQRSTMRAAQVAGRLGDHLARLVAVAEQGKAAADRAEGERAGRIRDAEQELEGRLVDWLGVRDELQHRGSGNVDELRASLLSYRADLQERLRFDLSRSRDPRQWWEEEFEYRLRRDLEATVRRYEGQLERHITADLQWLDGRTQELFGRPVAARPGAHAPVMPDGPQRRDIDAPDLTRYRIGLRVAPAVAGLLGVLFIPGGILAMGLASAAALAAGELKLHGMVTEQRELVAAALPAAVDRAINAMSDELSTRVRSLYAGFLDDVERSSRGWHDTELAAIRGDDRDPPPGWAKLGVAARELRDEVRTAVETEGGAR